MQKNWKITETLAHGYSSESAHSELSNKYQHDKVPMIFKDVCILVLWSKVASALEGLKGNMSHTKIGEFMVHSLFILKSII